MAEMVSRTEFRALLKRFSKNGQLDEEMVRVINANLLFPSQLQTFSLTAGKKMLVDVPTGKLSKAELDAVYKIVKVRNYYDVKTGKSTRFILIVISVLITLLNILSNNEMSIPLLIIFSALVVGVALAINISMNRVMLGRMRRAFIAAVEQGYPKLKDTFEF